MSTDFLNKQAIAAVRQRSAILRAATADVEKAIINARERGIPVRTIADAAGVSPQTILNIVNRQLG